VSVVSVLAAGERARLVTRPLVVRDLGLIAYDRGWQLQKQIAAQVGAGAAIETLLLLEHPHTYTCGRRGGRDHILKSEQELAEEGVVVLDVDRGGDVTYHGPGQLVAYPIIRLRTGDARIDYPAYVRALEAVLIDTLADFAIDAMRLDGYSGAWVGDSGCEEKITAIGVKVDGLGITTHGIALNVTTDLNYFLHIVPCGIEDKGVTSMARLLGYAPEMQAVKRAFVRCFAQVFNYTV
jgi:lipoyl(octanoyl) transferase